MAYSATIETTRRIVSRDPVRVFDVVEAEASSSAEFSVNVPTVGTIVSIEWELSTPGSSVAMRPALRRETGAWDGSGANANADLYRASSSAPNGKIYPGVAYSAPLGVLYIRGGYTNAAEDAGGKLRILIKGAV